MKGPIIFPNSITYEVNSDDGKVSLKLMFNFSQMSKGVKILIHSEFSLKLGFFERIFSSNYGNFAEHLIKRHIVPYLESLREVNEKQELT